MTLAPRRRSLSWSGLRRRIAEERWSRMVGARARQVLVPPRPSAFGSWGRDSVIAPPARVTSPECIHIGDRVVVNEHAWFSVVSAVAGYQPRLRIGNDVLIDRLCHVACVGEIDIEDKVLIGERSLIGDTSHRYDLDMAVIDQPMAEPRPVRICYGAHLGMGALIMPGVTVGRQAFVGAGAVVVEDVPDRSVVVGNPARVIRRWDGSSWVRGEGAR